MAFNSIKISSFFTFSDTRITRSEIRQFLLALVAVAVLSIFMTKPSEGTLLVAANLVLVFCGAWFANQLMRGHKIAEEQALSIAIMYLSALLNCMVFVFVVGWMFFLPHELEALGRDALLSALLLTNASVFFDSTGPETDVQNIFSHLWLPAMIAQCCLISFLMFWPLRENRQRLIALGACMGLCVLLLVLQPWGASKDMAVGGVFAFFLGALVVTSYFSVGHMRFATPIGVMMTTLSLLMLSLFPGTSVLNQSILAGGIAFLFLGSLPENSPRSESKTRKRRFALFVHIFVWFLPLTVLFGAAFEPWNEKVVRILTVLAAVAAGYGSWSLWKSIYVAPIDATMPVRRRTVLLSGAITLLAAPLYLAEGVPQRLPSTANAALDVIGANDRLLDCPQATEGALQGLRTCSLGSAQGKATFLVWGDEQALGLRSVIDDAARAKGVHFLMVAHRDCVPLIGLQTRKIGGAPDGADCEQYSRQLVQAIPHLKSIQSVMMIGDWGRYGQTLPDDMSITLAPNDGTPFNPTDQNGFVAIAGENTLDALRNTGVTVFALRQVPIQPGFEPMQIARSDTPGMRALTSTRPPRGSLPYEQLRELEPQFSQVLRNAHATGKLRLIDTWPALCGINGCDTRTASGSFYATPTRLSRHGAWLLKPMLQDMFSTAKRIETNRIIAGI